MKISRNLWKSVASYLLAGFFMIGAIVNIFALQNAGEDYARWGYPDGFHYITGLLELITVGLLVRIASRFWGAALGALVMIGATATVVFHGEYAHATAPVVVLLVSIAIAWIHRPATTDGKMC